MKDLRSGGKLSAAFCDCQFFEAARLIRWLLLRQIRNGPDGLCGACAAPGPQRKRLGPTYSEKDVPQPQEDSALGFSITKRAPISSAVKSMVAFDR